MLSSCFKRSLVAASSLASFLLAGTAFADEGVAPVAPLAGANVGLIADSASGSAAVIDGVVGIDHARFQVIADVSYGRTAPFTSRKFEWFGVAGVGRWAVLPFRVTPIIGLGVTYSVFEGSRREDVVEGKGFGLLAEGGLMIRLRNHRLTGVLRGNLGPHDVRSGQPISGAPFQLGLLVGYAYVFR